MTQITASEAKKLSDANEHPIFKDIKEAAVNGNYQIRLASSMIDKSLEKKLKDLGYTIEISESRSGGRGGMSICRWSTISWI